MFLCKITQLQCNITAVTMRNFKFNVLCRIISLLCVWFNVCECLEVDNIDNWIFTSDAEERLSEKCRKQFLGYITQHGDDQKNLISKLELCK